MSDWKEEYKEVLQWQKGNPFVSNTFKLCIVALIFFLIAVHFYAIITFPFANILSSEILLSTVLILVVYLWIQELRDRYRLQLINKALLDAQERLKQDEIDTIAVLILALEAKGEYEYGHSKRVARYCVLIAQEMGLPKDRQKIIERAGILHDIGKLSIADSILKKPGPLTEEEWVVMRKHCQKSVEILEPLEFLSVEKEIILHHHERCDGKGYPDGLKGQEIPFESRIMAIADTFDAMNSERPYRKRLSKDAILAELRKVSGSQLDVSVVSVFLKILEQNPALWEKG